MITPEQLAACGTESGHQKALFAWAALNQKRFPELRLMFAIPNGSQRDKITAARLKAEGVKAGVPDIFLPFPSQGVAGLFIELKRPKTVGRSKGKVTECQADMLDELMKQGYGVFVAEGWEQARDVLIQYLS